VEIHHIGYLVKDINRAIEIFKGFGYVPESDVVHDEIGILTYVFCVIENIELNW